MAQKDLAFNQYKSDIPHLVKVISGFDEKTPQHVVDANKIELQKIYDNADLSDKEKQLVETVLINRVGPVDQNF